MKEVKNGRSASRIDGAGVAEGDREQTFDRVLVSVGRKPNSAVPGSRQDAREGRRARLHHGGCGAAHGGADDLRHRRRRRRADARAQGVARGARRRRGRSPGTKSRSSRRRFPPSSSPIPEVAWCGLTETEAQKQGRKVEIAKFPWAALGRAVAIDRPEGLTKLVIDPETERVLGVGIVGAGRRRADRRRRARGRDGRARDGPQAQHPPAPDAVARRSWRPPRCSSASRRTSTGQRSAVKSRRACQRFATVRVPKPRAGPGNRDLIVPQPWKPGPADRLSLRRS